MRFDIHTRMSSKRRHGLRLNGDILTLKGLIDQLSNLWVRRMFHECLEGPPSDAGTSTQSQEYVANLGIIACGRRHTSKSLYPLILTVAAATCCHIHKLVGALPKGITQIFIFIHPSPKRLYQRKSLRRFLTPPPPLKRIPHTRLIYKTRQCLSTRQRRAEIISATSLIA